MQRASASLLSLHPSVPTRPCLRSKLVVTFAEKLETVSQNLLLAAFGASCELGDKLLIVVRLF